MKGLGKAVNYLFMIFVLICSSSVLSCASKTETVSGNVQQEEMDRQIRSATGIAMMILDGNIEGAYYRMDNNFRALNTFEKFSQNWEKTVEGLGDLIDYAVDTSEYSVLNFYKIIKIDYKFSGGIVPARYLYNSITLMPLEVTFGGKKSLVTDCKLPLKDLCSDYFKLGCGISGYNLQSSAVRVPEYMNIVKEQFSSCTSTNLFKPSYILNQPGCIENLKNGNDEPALNFSSVNKTLEWCKENNVSVRGHTLVWHTQTPDWFFREGYKSEGNYVSRDVMIKRLDSFICQYLNYVQTNFPGTVYCWDVVNEAVDPENGDNTTDFMCRIENSQKPSGWYQTIGKDYPEVAFTIARKYADKDVKLFYNDYGTIGKKKRQYIYNLCKSLKEKNLIDGIGLQGYWDVKNPTLKDIEEAINQYSELGLEIQLTEWTIPVASDSSEGYIQQGERYASVLKLLQRLDTQGGGNANITCVSFFGVQDGFALNINDTNTSRLYDKDFNPKPVYYSIQDTFMLYY